MPDLEFIKITTYMFDDEKIRIIESMPDADSLLIIWVKLLCQAGKTYAGGYIRLSENVSYSEEELASVLSRPVNTVRLAIETFRRLNMIVADDRGIFLINYPKHQNIEAMDMAKEKNRLKVAKYRKKQRLLTIGNGNVTVTTPNVTEENKTKIKNKKEEEEFNNYKELLKKEFPTLDIDEEYKKFILWWSEGDKKLKRPKTAFRNWIVKAGKFQDEKSNPGSKNAGVNRINSDDPDKYTKGKYGHMVQR